MIVEYAIKGIAELQQEVGTHAEVIIESGNVPKLLNRRPSGSRPTSW